MTTWTLKRCPLPALLVIGVGATNASTPQLRPAFLLGGSVGPPITVCARLTGLQETPPAKTNAIGNSTITVSSAGQLLTGKITLHGMQGTGAYIREGAPGSIGAPIVTLQAGNHDVWIVPPGFILTPDQYQSLRDGNIYVNVDSNTYPEGEIRGQLSPANCGASTLRLTPAVRTVGLNPSVGKSYGYLVSRGQSAI